jgi:16S rRNA (cytosine1402-N4)-methyltransferase
VNSLDFRHKSALLEQSIQALEIKPDSIYIDGTVGGGGHSFEIAKKLTTGRLIAIDQDPDAIQAAGQRLSQYADRVTLIKANFSQIKEILALHGIENVDGILLDLGVSSHQFDTPQRGFSYNYDAPLDMRMSQNGKSASDLVNTASFAELARILREYGEEKFASKIASLIVKERSINIVKTTFELVELIKRAIPAAARRTGHHPARKTFQALRIAVNGELEALSELLDEALDILKPQGRLCIITFHSLEDRMVKQRFALWAQGCICPPDFPICICNNKPKVNIIYKKGIEPSQEEQEQNPRSRSARLRVIEKAAE